MDTSFERQSGKDEWLTMKFIPKILKTMSCWFFAGRLDRDGYGKLHCPYTKKDRAHQISYFLFKGTIPEGKCVCHSCDIRNCVNPEHLFLATNRENTADRHRKGRDARGIKNWNTKLSMKLARHIRYIYSKGGMSQRELAKKFNICQATVNEILHNKIWKDGYII